jgi:hypothetical protein
MNIKLFLIWVITIHTAVFLQPTQTKVMEDNWLSGDEIEWFHIPYNHLLSCIFVIKYDIYLFSFLSRSGKLMENKVIDV